MMNKDNRNDKIRKIAKKGLTLSLCAVLAGGLAAGKMCIRDSRRIYRQAIAEGIMDTLAEAGAMITHPGCGLCCGRAGGILTDGCLLYTSRCV